MLNFKWLNVFCALLFAVGATTDYFDGLIARKYSLVSKLGASFDHIADKLLVCSCLILLSGSGVLPEPVSILLIGRELVVMGMRMYAAERKISIQVNSFGKLKTATQDVAIVCLMINDAFWAPTMYQVGMGAIWVATILSLYSAYLYWESFWPLVKDEVLGK